MTEGPAREADGEATRERVRERYARLAERGSCCSPGPIAAAGDAESTGCCGADGECVTAGFGYSREELAGLPVGADLGLGCGHPTALVPLTSGQIVLDLGSGAGIDCFLAARQVGPTGRVIGVDMTPAMVAKARANARAAEARNVEFRLGEIEHLPVADHSVDVVISNCVINLAPDKGPVYREAFRVLRAGGRFAVSDVVATRAISAAERADPSLWSSCSSGALEVEEIRRLLGAAGFVAVDVDVKGVAPTEASLAGQAALGVVAADIRATKPAEA